jgi:hypothetical protein
MSSPRPLLQRVVNGIGFATHPFSDVIQKQAKPAI